MLAGDPYIADDPEIAADWLRYAPLVREYNAISPAEPTRRATLLRELLGSVGSGTVIRSSLQCDYGYQTTIGARGFANWGLVRLDVGRITLGNDVQFGPNVNCTRRLIRC
jgi:maltose O-acetyltransferase